MSRIAYVNGQYVPHGQAAVHVEDRGYQFADGVYEVCEIRNDHVADETRHMDRLERSLRELRIVMPMSRAAMCVVLHEVVRRNRVSNGLIYIQVTRGVSPRDHVFPPDDVLPSVVMTAKKVDLRKTDAKAHETGVAVITTPDNRWERVDIKSVSLLPNILAKQAAKEAGATEAWFVDGDGFVTEGSSTNAWIVTQDGTLVTRPAENGILRGITRAAVMDLAARDGINVEERMFTVEEAEKAREAFITAATTIVMPVVRINDTSVGNGSPGSIATALRDAFHSVAEMVPLN